MKILVTGVAGFIGFHLGQRLLAAGHEIVGLDNLNDYYDVQLKKDRLAQLEGRANFHFVRGELADRSAMEVLFRSERPRRVVHLAAQAGVRYSIDNPHAYAESNLVGFLNILEGCRHFEVEHLVYASSSSVYGDNRKIPFSEHDSVDHPVSFYAASKKANEMMAHSYSHMYGLPTTGLRFFTVYGPWGRPDMAMFLFTKAILAGKPIQVFNHGKMRRDFTYVDDITAGIERVVAKIPERDADWGRDPGALADPATSSAPYRVYNIGNGQPVDLMRFIEVIETTVGTKAIIEFLPMQPGDVPSTYADVSELFAAVGYRPSTPVEVGARAFVEWYRQYYGV